MTANPAPDVLKVREVAALLRMGVRQTYEAIYRGDIPCHRIGSQVRCSKLAIDRWLNGHEPNGNHREEVSSDDVGRNDGEDLEVGRTNDARPSPRAVMAEVR
jgi:excisionase family DNA binding protein